MFIHGQLRKPQHTYAKRAVRKAHFKVIPHPGHPCWCRQKSRTVCDRNVQLMPTLFLKRTKIWQRETANSSISTPSRRFEDVPARNAFEYLQMIYIARNQSHWVIFCRW